MIAVWMYKRILLLGDSQTQCGASPQGWVNLLAEKYCRYLDITNRGLSGYNTRWTLDRICDIVPAVPAYHYDLGVVWFGANDAVREGYSQHVPQREYSSNLTQIVSKLIDCIGIQPYNILILTPACIDEAMLNKVFSDEARSNERMREYADLALTVAHERHCQSADLFSLFSDHVTEDLFTDGLHLEKRGNKLVADVVDKFLSGRVHQTLPIPDWKDLC